MKHRTRQLWGALYVCSVALTAAFGLPASNAAAEPAHGLSSFGQLKYPVDFTHFDYVNPDAPVGGRLSTIGGVGAYNTNPRTFNSFNGYALQGDAPFGINLLFDTLMVRAFDEPDAVYGLVAHSAERDEDGLGVTFYLRPEAAFADGTAVTAEDLVYSFYTLKEHGHPGLTSQIRDVVSADAIDAHTVHYRFNGEAVRDLAQRVAVLPIFSKSYYEGRNFGAATLEAPLGSGPYVIEDFEQARYISYRRRDDYWGWDVPVMRGRYNFGEIRFEYFRDREAELEALKVGEFDLREEFTAHSWATRYDTRAVLEGRLVRDKLPDDRPSGAQGFFLNLRREKFQDVRVRRALELAFDFEWANANLFHDQYTRTQSFFENSSLKAQGKPSEAELELLMPLQELLPEEVFDEVAVPPVSDGSGQDRDLLRQASDLLNEAGWKVVDGMRQNADGAPLEIEFLIFSESMERVLSFYIENLTRLGIDARIRDVDPVQYQERVTGFDFDITVRRYALSTTPGAELRNYWGSEAASTPGSSNLSGISDPAVDALIEHVLEAETREELTIAAQALDRVLRAGHYWVPHWYRPSHLIAYWNRFSRPQFKPKFARGIIDTWWFDAEKSQELDYSE